MSWPMFIPQTKITQKTSLLFPEVFYAQTAANKHTPMELQKQIRKKVKMTISMYLRKNLLKSICIEYYVRRGLEWT